MQKSLDEKEGKEKEQGINYQSYRMNFTLIGNTVPVGARDEKNYTMLNIWTLIHIVPVSSKPHMVSKAQILADLQCIITTRIK